MNRNESNRFATNPINLDISRSTFDLDHKVVFSGDIGEVIPVSCIEILPGDTFNVATSKVVRMQPLVTPIMDSVFLDTYWFFCPTRLVWEHWKQFNGENTDTAWVPQVQYTVPQLTVPSGGFDVGTIADYMGIPPKAGAGKTINALPFRCYAKICEDWFRSENLMNPVHIHIDDTTRTGVNTGDQTTDIELGGQPFIACKYFDYFTAALPNSQKAAGPTVEFALNGLLPVNAYGTKSNLPNGTYASGTREADQAHMVGYKTYTNSGGNVTVSNNSGEKIPHIANSTGYMFGVTGSGTNAGYLTPYNLFADLNNTSIFDINSLRQAFAIQRYYEKAARSGTRYIEVIRGFFGVDSPDARLQRSEYLGGNRVPLNVRDCAQQSATQSGLTPQGNLTGISATGDVSQDFVKSFTEHGFLICCCVARYHHSYQQSCERFWFRKTLWDYYNPTFANLGEVGIYTKELYFDAPDDDIFGFQEAWADYRMKPSSVHGEMRSVYSTPLDSWHLADYYNSQPYLSDSWIREDKTMLDRCLAVTSAVSNQLIFDYYVECKATRPMPLYSIPGLIDHH